VPSASETTATSVSGRSDTVPGNAAKPGAIPNGIVGSTGTPSGSDASTETRSARIESVASER
jgi:hypothetical protein